jgi:hypothetical protein
MINSLQISQATPTRSEWRAAVSCLLWVAAVWLTIWLYGAIIQPLISIQYSLPVSGALGNPAVTGTSPATGLVRFAGLLVLLVLLGLAASRAKVLAGCRRFFASPGRACILLIAAGVPFFMLASGSSSIARSWSARPVDRLVMIVFASLTVAACFFLSGAVARAREWLCGEPPAALVAVIFAAALAAFVKWPLMPAAAVLTLFLLGCLPALYKAFRSKTFTVRIKKLAWSLAIPVAVVGLSGVNIHARVDPHHEAEDILPAHMMQQGRLPFLDFEISHSLITDCLPDWIAFSVAGPTLHTERTMLGFVASPLRGLLVWLVLSALFGRGLAIVLWILAALGGATQVVAANDAFRLDLALTVVLFFIHFDTSGRRIYAYLAAAAAAIGAVLSPELGIPFAAGALLVMALQIDLSWSKRAALVFFTTLAALLGVLFAAGMLAGFIHWVSSLRSMALELIARWPAQEVLERHILVHLGVLAFAVVTIFRVGPRSDGARPLVLLLVAGAGITFSLFADDPLRLERTIIIDLLLLGSTLVACRAGRSPVTLALLALLVLSGAGISSQPANWLVGKKPPAGWQAAGEIERIGQIGMPPEDVQTWRELVAFGKQGAYFNASNSLLDLFVNENSRSLEFVPMHLAYRPRAQARLVEKLIELSPARIIFRTMRDPAFWQVTPYTLIFNRLDAYILRNYSFASEIGPYQIVARSDPRTSRTYNNLLAPGVRRPLEYGLAPLFLGKLRGEGLAQLCDGLPEPVFFEIVAHGAGKARLLIASRIEGGGSVPLSVVFKLAKDGALHTYRLPLWNLCTPGTAGLEDTFNFDVSTDTGITIEKSGLRSCAELLSP